ncbi:hypothetical protein LINPERPRIM_LOCUS2943 [Linum perenne]
MATHYVNELDSEDDQNVFHDSENEASDEYDNVEDGIAVDRQPFRIYTNYVGDADSDYIESDDDLESIYSTDEEGKKEQPKFKQFDGVMEMNNPKFCKGQLFPDFKTFKEAVKNYSIVNMQPIKFKHSDSIRVQVVCRPPCKFNIWAAKSNDGNAIQIRSCELKHEGCILRFENKFGDYHYIAKKYQHRFQVDPKLSISSIRQMVKEDLHWNISKSKAWHVKNEDLKLVRGSAEEQYKKLREYCGELRRSNIGSSVFVETNEDGVFKRIYCCLAACRDGFLAGCRKVVCLDGCFLKTLHGGQLLSAVGIDGNDGIFPIAYAVVGVENGDNWTWFLQYLCRDIDIEENNGGWTFMSDKQKVTTFRNAYLYFILVISFPFNLY